MARSDGQGLRSVSQARRSLANRLRCRDFVKRLLLSSPDSINHFAVFRLLDPRHASLETNLDA